MRGGSRARQPDRGRVVAQTQCAHDHVTAPCRRALDEACKFGDGDRVEAELEGRITRIDGPRRFAVDGVTVDASAASLAAGAALLALGARAVVHGRSVQGQLRATTVRVEPDEPVELECVVSAADALRQTFVLKGLTVAWSATTVFEGGSARLLRARRRAAVIGRWNPDRSVLEASHIHVEA